MFDLIENFLRSIRIRPDTAYLFILIFIGSLIPIYYVLYYVILKLRVKNLGSFFKKNAFHFQEDATLEITDLLSVYSDISFSKTRVENDGPQLPVLGMGNLINVKFPYLAKRELQKHKIFVFDFNYNLGNEGFVNGVGVLIQNPLLAGLPRVSLVRKNMDFGRTGIPVAKIVPGFKAFKALFAKESEVEARAFFEFLGRLPQAPSVLKGVDFTPNSVLFYFHRRYFGGMKEMKKFIELSEKMLPEKVSLYNSTIYSLGSQ